MSAVTGVVEMNAKFDELKAKVRKACVVALREEAQSVLDASHGRVPVDTGLLQASGFKSEPEWSDDDQCSITVGYGQGAAGEYAFIVHEDLEARHTVGQAKYLESVLDERRAGFTDRIGALIKRESGL